MAFSFTVGTVNARFRWLSLFLGALVAVTSMVWPALPASANGSPSVTVSNFSVAPSSTATFTVGLSNFDAGTYIVTMSVPSGSGTLAPSTQNGLSQTGTFSLTGANEIGFEGTREAVTTAMTNMSFTSSANPGSVTLSVSVAQSSDGNSVDPNLFYNSGNGNYYKLVDNGSALTWETARAAAAASTFLGATGYLATITSSSENSFIATKTTAASIWIGASDEFGAINRATRQTTFANQTASEGKWYWVTGPEAGTQFFDQSTQQAVGGRFENWAANEPNNSGSAQHHAITNWNVGGEWDDSNVDGAQRYLIEFTGGDTTGDSASASATISVASIPTVTSLSPEAGAESGGTFVTVTGSGFQDDSGNSLVTGVTIGGAAATEIDVISATSLSLKTPAGTGSSNQVIVTTSIGSSTDLVNFTYEADGLFPTVTGVTPSSGTVAGGTSIEVTGTGFTSASKVFIDGVELNTSYNPTTGKLTATTPSRTSSDTNLTVGAKALQVRVPRDGSNLANGYRASGEEVFFSYAPALEDPNDDNYAFPPGRVELGTTLAARTQAKPLSKTGTSAPYTMSGFIGPRISGRIDTAADYANYPTYSYQTDRSYSSSPSGNGREGFEVPSSAISYGSYTVSKVDANTPDESWQMSSSLGCNNYNNNAGDGVSAYCSIFGPQLISEPFYATSGQSISFTWKAEDGGDDYEVYAYLVSVSSQTDLSFADGDHTTILHSRGALTDFTTTAASIPSTGLYRFRFVNGSFDATGGQALGAQMYVKTAVVLGRSNSITFGAIADRTTSDADPFTVTTSATSGAEVSVAASGACSATTSHSGGITTVTISRTSVGSRLCTLTASQGQEGLFAPASSVTRSFNYPTVSTPNQPTALTATAGNQQASVVFTPPTSNGGVAITNYEYQLDGGSWVTLSPASTATTIVITGLTNGTQYSIKVRAVNAQGSGTASDAVVVTPAAPPTSQNRPRNNDDPVISSPAPATFRIPTPPTNFTNTAPPPVPGPVNRGPQTAPPTNPLATVNGVPTPTNTQTIGNTGVRVTTGTLDFGVRVPNETQGRITQNQSGSPELSVVRNQSTIFSGQGVLPGSTVQVFMSFGPNQSAELARIPVDANGTFNGQAALQTPGSNTPLPIGRHVLQVVSVDQNGNQTVVDMPINVAQPNPQPEILLTNGQTPTLPPGQSLATRAGEPVNVNIIPVPDNKQAIIDGGDWTMSIIAEGDGSNLTETEDGRVLVEFIRDEAANVSGSGFLPDTRADVWLFSEPTLLGTVDIDENGEFNGSINVDGRVVAVGEHTLQLQGVGEDGYVRAANLGVVVNDADGAAATTEQSSLTWIWWLIALLAVIALAVAYWYWRRQQSAS